MAKVTKLKISGHHLELYVQLLLTFDRLDENQSNKKQNTEYSFFSCFVSTTFKVPFIIIGFSTFTRGVSKIEKIIVKILAELQKAELRHSYWLKGGNYYIKCLRISNSCVLILFQPI